MTAAVQLAPELETALAQRMSAEEARACVDLIREGADRTRAALLDLDERDGWEALGYESLRECMVAEFAGAERTLYQELTAAHIERDLRHGAKNPPAYLPERHARELKFEILAAVSTR
jgi:hypothetical protein